MINLKTIKYANKEVKKIFSSKKHYKLVILIIASRAVHYDLFTYCWLQYMHLFPEVKSFFLYADNTIENDLFIDEHSITYKCEESYIPGILFKTIAAKKFCQRSLTYDYMVRTNLSSVIHIPRLITYLENKPRIDFMCTNIECFPLALSDDEYDRNDKTISHLIDYNKENWKKHTEILRNFFGFKQFFENNKKFFFLPGSFYIMSYDVIDKLLYEIFTNNILSRADLYLIPDDLAISAIVQLETIQPKKFINTMKYSKQCDQLELKPDEFGENIFHVRNRTDLIYGNRRRDVINVIQQVRCFYNMPDLFPDDE